jgi:hypothetical protein
MQMQDISDARLERLLRFGDPPARPISGFTVTFNPVTNGTKVAFTLANGANIETLTLKRNSTLDYGSAIVLNTWNVRALANGTALSYDDNDALLAQFAEWNYWIDCAPLINVENLVTVGPESVLLNLDAVVPSAIVDFDASHSAAIGGLVTIGISFNPANEARFGSCKIRIAGYNGVASFVDIAQNGTSPFSFKLQQTGETVTLKAIAVSQNGLQASTGPTKTLTLGVAATVPAKIIGATATELSTGVQIGFPAGPESNITLYSIYRGPKDGGFGGASSIGTVTPTGATVYTFLDSGGLTGIFEWYVIATTSAGNSAASSAIVTGQSSRTSADQPINAPSNTTNQATVDSADAGVSATIRIYGTGGLGSSWVRPTGFGSQTFPGGSITSKSYTTVYYVVYDTVNAQYLAFTSLISALPDTFAWAGKVTTVAAGGTGGSSGGGGAGGGSGGFCPDEETWLDDIQAKDAYRGLLVDCLIDGKIVKKPILSIEFADAECFLVIAGRAAKVVSWDTRFDLPDGSWKRCYEMEGQPVFTDDGWLPCKTFYAGRRRVARIDLGGATFAGSVVRGGCRIFSHNISNK